MNVANLELSRELYELSGWGDPDGEAPLGEYDLYFTQAMWCQESEKSDWELYTEPSDHTIYGNNHIYPAYDLGFLLRKLPKLARLDRGARNWHCTVLMNGFVAHADTPEDAACKLAIELWKQGVLK